MRQVAFVASVLVSVSGCGNIQHPPLLTSYTDAGLDAGSKAPVVDTSMLDGEVSAAGAADSAIPYTAGRGGSDAPIEPMDAGPSVGGSGGIVAYRGSEGGGPS